jgi:aubergine-like protein
MDEERNYGEDLNERIENLIGKRFVPEGSTKSKLIYDIDKDLTPKNSSTNYGKELFPNFIEFFQKVFKKKVEHEDQPLILVKVKGPQGEDKLNKYVPEFCWLNGINENDINSFEFMKKLSQETKLEPDEKVKKIDKCIHLFYDKTEKKTKK